MTQPGTYIDEFGELWHLHTIPDNEQEKVHLEGALDHVVEMPLFAFEISVKHGAYKLTWTCQEGQAWRKKEAQPCTAS